MRKMMVVAAFCMVLASGCGMKFPLKGEKVATIPAGDSVSFTAGDSKGLILKAEIDLSVFKKSLEGEVAEAVSGYNFMGPYYLVIGAEPILPSGVIFIGE
jgi:hypothetical protein